MYRGNLTLSTRPDTIYCDQRIQRIRFDEFTGPNKTIGPTYTGPGSKPLTQSTYPDLTPNYSRTYPYQARNVDKSNENI